MPLVDRSVPGLGKIASWKVVGSRMFIAVTVAFACVAYSVGGSTSGLWGRWGAGVPNQRPDRTHLVPLCVKERSAWPSFCFSFQL
jgi:hypothetical protein